MVILFRICVSYFDFKSYYWALLKKENTKQFTALGMLFDTYINCLMRLRSIYKKCEKVFWKSGKLVCILFLPALLRSV